MSADRLLALGLGAIYAGALVVGIGVYRWLRQERHV